jgi:hypothetical protein
MPGPEPTTRRLISTLAVVVLTAVPLQPGRVIGLVELPGLFGSREPDSPPGLIPPARVEPIPLHAEPSEGR